jgi:hypothetical protein
MTSPTNGKFAVSLSIASAARILSLSKTGGRPPLRPRFTAPQATDPTVGTRLWELSEELTGLTFEPA